MAKHSVNVIVKAKDEASRKFGVITASARVMGKALKGTASMIKTAFRASFQVIKRAALGIAAAFAYSTYAAIKQQAAEIELASALKMTGEYTEANMQKMKAYAAAIQEATVYGDEQVLMLMRQAMTLGWTADQAGAAAKAAIALFEGFGGGRGKPAIFLRYYTDAIRGTGTSLASYVGELRKAKTEQERMDVLNKALSRGWDVAKSKAESAGGALKQMKNKLGDVAEYIGKPFLPTITRSAKAIKQWAAENESAIGAWAEKVHSYVIAIKDIFVEFIKFMKEDWRSGIQWVFDSFLKLLKAAFESAISLAIAGGRGIWKGVKEGILGGGEEEKIREAIKVEIQRRGGGYEINYETGEVTPVGAESARIAAEIRRKYEAEKVKSILGDTLETVKEGWKKTFADIIKGMPPDLGKAFDEALKKHEKRLVEIKAKPPGKPGEVSTEGWPSAFPNILEKALAGMKRGLAPLEARFLTFGPGVRFNYEQETAKNTSNIFKVLNEQLKEERQLRKELIHELPRRLMQQPQGPIFGIANFT